MRIGSLFSGAGGLDLAVAEHYSAEVVWHVENDRSASAVLVQHWPDAPNLGDITKIDWESEELMGAHRADALAQHMYDRYCQGLSLEQVAEEFNRSRQTVWKMFDRRGWSLRPRSGPERDGCTYNGLVYRLANTGYLRCTTGGREYLHRQVWMDHHGARIPPGHDIHHVDHNKLNNHPSNLRLLTASEHTKLHREEVVPANTPAVDILTAGWP